MPEVDTKHPDYDKAHQAWRLVRDTAFGGGREVKRAGVHYLPMVRGMTPGDYAAYVQRALFYNATKRTLAAFVGFIYTNNPETKWATDKPQGNIKTLVQDATMAGNSFYDYGKQAVRNVTSIGRTGTLVEWASPAMQNRPFVIRYETEDILNWRYAVVEGRRQLVLVTLREKSEVASPGDPLQPETEERIRMLQLVVDGGKPYCVAELYQKDGEQGWSRIDQQVPMRRTTPLPFIPFVFHNTLGDDAEPKDIPFDDLASVNVSHYHNSADIEQGRHICGLPTLVLTGFPMKGEYYLGATQALVSEDTQSRAMFLQISSETLKALETAMTEKEKLMATLGARMLENQQQGAQREAFQTVMIRQSADVATLTDVAISCSETISKVMRICVWWDDVSVPTPDDLTEEVYLELNTEFLAPPMDPAKMTSLLQMYQTKALSYAEFFRNLQKGGIISSEKKMEDEVADIEDNPAGMPPPGDLAQPGPGKPPAPGAKPPPQPGTKPPPTNPQPPAK